MGTTVLRFLRDLLALARPYWSSDERWMARGLLAAILALTLGQVYVSVLINQWNNAFYDALQNKDYAEFLHQLLIFCGLAAAFIIAAVYQQYLNQMLQIRWRRWLTERYLARWLSGQTYYRLQLTDRGTDNPDQRIAQDLQLFVDQTLSLTLGFVNSAVTLVSFLGILWGLSGTLSFDLGGVPLSIPGYMLWVALLYSIVGTWLTHLIGWPLVRFSFDQQRYEADFRFSLVRLRENVEGVALYGGEDEELQSLRSRFARIVGNWRAIMRRQKQINWFTSGYGQVAIVFPYLVAAPRYFSGAIQLGGLMQTASAFNQVLGSMSWFVRAYPSLAEWKATVDRLTGFEQAMRAVKDPGEGGERIVVQRAPEPALAIDDVTLALPSGRGILPALNLQLAPRESVLISGPSGAGKSTLLRAIAGIWPFGRGAVRVPDAARPLFLPQTPYLPLGALRRVIAYPGDVASFDDDAIGEVLRAVGLDHLQSRLDEAGAWSLMLSPGEQQRIAVARALLLKPDWLFLDEATSALDEPGEAKLYRLLRQRLPDTTMVSVGHRGTLAQFHDRRIEIGRPDIDRRQPALAAAGERVSAAE